MFYKCQNLDKPRRNSLRYTYIVHHYRIYIRVFRRVAFSESVSTTTFIGKQVAVTMYSNQSRAKNHAKLVETSNVRVTLLSIQYVSSLPLEEHHHVRSVQLWCECGGETKNSVGSKSPECDSGLEVARGAITSVNAKVTRTVVPRKQMES